MNKVITINLGGTAYQLEEPGYDALRAYLETAGSRLEGNPDRDEIVSDVERSIGEKFQTRLSAHKNVVTSQEVSAVLNEMGPVNDGIAAEEAGTEKPERETPGASASGSGAKPVKRLYRIYDGAMLSGVCNGLAAYFGIDPTIVRIAFVLAAFLWGASLLVYLLLVIVVPQAKSAEEKAASSGEPFTTQEFIRRAREGYYEAMKNFSDRHAHREWKRQFKHEMRGWRRTFRHEMRARAWEQAACRPNIVGAAPVPLVALPVISLIHGAVTLFWLCATISLLATGTFFGATLPAQVPVWIVVVVLLFAYGFVSWPLKATRRAFYHGACSGPPWAWPFVFMIDVVVWLAFAAVLLWLAFHFLPVAHDALQHLPGVAREAAENIRDWWQRK